MPKKLGIVKTKTFNCTVYEDADGRVHFTADADIDADGANGQNGKPAAYRVGDKGTDLLENGGMEMRHGRVVCRTDDALDIAIIDVNGDMQPIEFPGGIIASETAYVIPGKARNDPSAYLDSETVPYVVVPPLIVSKTVGVVMGCKARVTWKGKSVECVVGDKCSATAIGEISIQAARALGVENTSPRNGGIESQDAFYELWPGVAAPGYVLQPS